jgi:hypothetical protein
MFSDNREIAIIALAKKDNNIQHEAIIVFREKLKTPFRINLRGAVEKGVL